MRVCVEERDGVTKFICSSREGVRQKSLTVNVSFLQFFASSMESMLFGRLGCVCGKVVGQNLYLLHDESSEGMVYVVVCCTPTL